MDGRLLGDHSSADAADVHPDDVHPENVHPDDVHPDDVHPDDVHPTTRRNLAYASFFLLALLLAVAAVVIEDTESATAKLRSPPTGVLPLLPTYCVSWQPNNQPYYVPLRVDGVLYAVLPDTGSSNLALASSACASCDVHPPVPRRALPPSVRIRPDPTTSPLAFETAYGTGATTAVTSPVEITIDEGGMVLPRRGRKALAAERRQGVRRADGTADDAGADTLAGAVETGRAGLIVSQNTSFGFSLFPAKPPGGAAAMPAVATPTTDTCYDSYAGILGLAYQGQGSRALPGYAGTGPAPTTNGTTTQLIDQLVAQLGMRNSFALEFCPRYPWSCAPQRRPRKSSLPDSPNATWAPQTPCAEERVGHLLLGGYASGRLEASLEDSAEVAPEKDAKAGARTIADRNDISSNNNANTNANPNPIPAQVLWAALTDEIHFDVQLRGMRVCGRRGCIERVPFPDKFDGVDESDCMCDNATARCDATSIADPRRFDYCYFAVVESGAGRMYMNTPGNARALLDAMVTVEVVDLPKRARENATLVHDFYFNKVPVEGARVWPNASFHVLLLEARASEGGEIGEKRTRPLFRDRIRESASRGTETIHEAGNTIIHVPVELDGSIFRPANFSANEHHHPQQGCGGGLVQWGVQGDMGVLRSFSANKFPTLLGDPFLAGKTTIFDRSRKRIGFGRTRRDLCTAGVSGVGAVPARASDVDVLGANAKATPGYGCRIGSGSGGGCPQARAPSR